MPETNTDLIQLEAYLDSFIKEKDKDIYVKIMEILEKSIILIPAFLPKDVSPEITEQLKAGKPVKLPEKAKIVPCLLRKPTGEQALPVFTSPKQIPEDKKSPSILTSTFFGCVSMVMANQEKIEAIVVNPFTHNMVLPRNVLEVANKRGQAAMKKQPKAIKVTAEQLHVLVHNRVILSELPKFIYERGQEGVRELQRGEGVFLLPMYEKLYPKDIRPPYLEDDFSVMTLNVSENVQITRLDLPDQEEKEGICYRVYVAYRQDTGELFYYTLEKTKQGNIVGKVEKEGTHTIVMEAPDNGAEIETIMGLVSTM